MADQLQNQSGGGTAGQAQQNQVLGSLFGLDQNVLNIGLPSGPAPRPGSQVALGGRGATTVLQQVSAFYHLSSDQRDAIAQRLADAGYLELPAPDSKGRVKKLSPVKVQDAFKSAVLDAARAGTSVGELLDEASQSQDASGTSGTGTSQVTKSTNPLDVQALGQSAAQKGLGQNLTADQLSQFQGDFASAESPYLNSSATQSEPGAEGWAQWAQQRVREFDPKKFDARQVLGGVDVLAKMLNAGGNASSITGGA